MIDYEYVSSHIESNYHFSMTNMWYLIRVNVADSKHVKLRHHKYKGHSTEMSSLSSSSIVPIRQWIRQCEIQGQDLGLMHISGILAGGASSYIFQPILLSAMVATSESSQQTRTSSKISSKAQYN